MGVQVHLSAKGRRGGDGRVCPHPVCALQGGLGDRPGGTRRQVRRHPGDPPAPDAWGALEATQRRGVTGNQPQERRAGPVILPKC